MRSLRNKYSLLRCVSGVGVVSYNPPPGYSLQFGAVTRIEFRQMKGRGDGLQKDNYETVLGVFQFVFQHNENESTIKIQTSLDESPLGSVGMDEMADANRTLVWVTHRTTGRGIQTMIGHSHSGQNSRQAANVEREVGQPSIVYPKRRLYAETVGGISHGSVPCLRPTGRRV